MKINLSERQLNIKDLCDKIETEKEVDIIIANSLDIIKYLKYKLPISAYKSYNQTLERLKATLTFDNNYNKKVVVGIGGGSTTLKK